MEYIRLVGGTVLRLHPPTGRLPQLPGFPSWGSASDEVADLEALHRVTYTSLQTIRP